MSHHHRLLTLAAAIYITDTGLRWNRSHDGRRLLRTLGWALLCIIAALGILLLALAPYSNDPARCAMYAAPFFVPLVIAKWRKI